MGLSFRSRFFFLSLAILFLCSLCVLSWFLFVPLSKGDGTKIIFIKKGTPLKKVSEVLEHEGIIKNRHFFVLLTTLLGKKGKIKAGEYEFHTRMVPWEVLSALTKGQVKLHLVTIPEGFTLSQIAQLLEASNLTEKKGFLQKTSSPSFIDDLGLSPLAGPTLEGYLFPDTYHLLREMEPEEVIQMMVHQFKKVFGPEFAHWASELGISEREVVILASIIEKETSLSEEKPLISAVFHNRLRKRMPLQSDPTVIYGINNFNGNLTKDDLMRPTPYNTYLLSGLPPTPICNPGRESLFAAVHPAPVPYLYFVSKNDGSHYFSSDIEDHNRAVWKYQKTLRRNNLTKK
ncbi:MAG TPA: endolytic transglycosylase MltG [Thermodesulfobacteriota bacterium]|nr:endolytic transglycosylase MltG [Thermodesulfobacteriota bacterium]